MTILTSLLTQAYTSQIVVMAMLALAIGGDTISTQARREAIIDGLCDLPSKPWFSFFDFHIQNISVAILYPRSTYLHCLFSL